MSSSQHKQIDDETLQESTCLGDAGHSRDEKQCRQPKKWDFPKRDIDKRGYKDGQKKP